MSRLETKGEPSMEEILASIRRIIAEEPPGSRPGPAYGRPAAQPATAAPAPQQRGGFMSGDAFMRTAGSPTEPAFNGPSGRSIEFAPKNEPSLPFQRSPSFTDGAKPSQPTTRLDEAVKEAKRAAEPKLADAPSTYGDQQSATAAAIEAQLNDLLSDIPQNDAGSPAPAGGQTSSSADAARTQVETASTSKASEDASLTDPFAFDLGPSPFAARRAAAAASEEIIAVEPAKPEPVSEAAIAAEPPKPEVVTLAAEASRIEPMADPVEAVAPSVESGVADKEADDAAFASVDNALQELRDSQTAKTPFTTPSVGATIGPAITSPASSPRAPYHERGASTVRPFRNFAEPPFADLGRRESVTPQSYTEKSSTALTTARANELFADDQMEDAVADLLRPMLRTWLAENMPRIVERALRREMLENFGNEQKGAAE